jgi:hypothetical protein
MAVNKNVKNCYNVHQASFDSNCWVNSTVCFLLLKINQLNITVLFFSIYKVNHSYPFPRDISMLRLRLIKFIWMILKIMCWMRLIGMKLIWIACFSVIIYVSLPRFSVVYCSFVYFRTLFLLKMERTIQNICLKVIL